MWTARPAYPIVYDPGFTFTTNAAIGATGDMQASFFGSLDEVAIYNSDLSGSEVVGQYYTRSVNQTSNIIQSNLIGTDADGTRIRSQTSATALRSPIRRQISSAAASPTPAT